METESQIKYPAFLTGLRGIFALYVVFHHCFLELTGRAFSPDLSPGWLTCLSWLDYGEVAVSAFLVVSGFSLLFSVFQSPNLRLRGGFKGYLGRRAKRILPPYYGALFFCLAAICYLPNLDARIGTRSDLSLPDRPISGFISHLFLVHTVIREWKFRFDPPMWSISVEWLLYFLFPLALLPLYRKLGWEAVLFAACAISFLTEHYLPAAQPLSVSLMISFVIGMGAAHFVYGRPRIKWLGVLFLPVTLCILTAEFIARDRNFYSTFDGNFLPALLVAILILLCVKYGKLQAFRRFCESRPCLALGSFSYSLYLIHWPILNAVHNYCFLNGYSGEDTFLCLVGIAAPLSLLAGWGLYFVFERPFLFPNAGLKAYESTQVDVVANLSGPVESIS
jgi:peptidoglycan/LPS O-acetylase OafA/YrhL